MTDPTMTTRLRQVEDAIRAMAQELGVSTDTPYDFLQVGVYEGRFTVSVTQLEGYRYVTGKTLEEAHLKMLNPTIPF